MKLSSWESLRRESHHLREELQDLRKRRTALTVLIELILLACLTALLVVCLTIQKLNKGFQILGLEAWRWWVLLFTAVAGGPAALLIMDALTFCLGRSNFVLEKKIETRTRRLGQAGQARSNYLQDRNEDAHVVEIDDDQHQPKSSQSTSEEGLEERKHLKLLEMLLELGDKVEQMLVASKRSMGFVIWVACVLATWILLFRNDSVRLPEHRSKIFNRITTALASVLLGAIVWMAKTVWLQVLAFSFIVERSRERIRNAQKEQMLLHDIWTRVQKDFNKKNKEKKMPDEPGSGHPTEGQVLVLPSELEHINKRRNWTPERTIRKISGITLPLLVEDSDDIGNVQRAARVTAAWFFELIVGAYDGDTNGAVDHQQTPVSKKNKCVIISGKNEKLIRAKLEEVTPAVRSFQFTAKGVRLIPRISRIRRSELEELLVKVYVDRLVLIRTINGRDNVVSDLNRILSIMVVFFNVLMFLLIMNLMTTTVAVSIAAQIVALNFMFGESAKTAFKAFFFVFETRPFDVGDRCEIKDGDDTCKEVVVHDMNFLSTTFTKPDGDKIYYPNSLLMDKSIENFYLVPDTKDVMEFYVKAQKDPESFCQGLAEKIKPYLESKKKYWYPEFSDFSVVIEDVANNKKEHLVVVTVKHQVNYYNLMERAKYRDHLLLKLQEFLNRECKNS